MGKGIDYERGRRDRQAARRAAIDRGEVPTNYHPRPELRLRNDTPALDIDERTAQELAGQLTPREYGVAIRDPNGAVMAMIVPLDRYIELASGTIAGDYHFGADVSASDPTTGRPRIQAHPDSLEALHVEQVDPQAEWWPGSHPRQHNLNQPPQ